MRDALWSRRTRKSFFFGPLLLVFSAVFLCASCGGSGAPTAPSTPNVAGNYSLQFNASSSCSQGLPSAARNRSYGTVVVTQSGKDVTMTATTSVGALPMFFGQITSSSQVVGYLELHDGFGFDVTGSAQFGISGSTLTKGTLNGAIFGGTQICTAADHQLSIQRR